MDNNEQRAEELKAKLKTKERLCEVLGMAAGEFYERWKHEEIRAERYERLLEQAEREIERLKTPAPETYREL